MFIPDPDPDFLPIPDPVSRGQKGTGSRIRIRNTGGRDVEGGLGDGVGGWRERVGRWREGVGGGGGEMEEVNDAGA